MYWQCTLYIESGIPEISTITHGEHEEHIQ